MYKILDMSIIRRLPAYSDEYIEEEMLSPLIIAKKFRSADVVYLVSEI